MKKLRMLRLIKIERGAVRLRRLLWLGLMVDVLGLAVVATVGLQATASPQATAGATAPTAANDLADEAMADDTARRCAGLNMSATEFGAALRAGEVSSGLWNPETRTFSVETHASAVRRRMHGSTTNGSAASRVYCG